MINCSFLSMVVYKSAFFYLRRKWNKVVGIGSRLRAGRFEVRIPQEKEIFPLHQNMQTGSAPQSTSYARHRGSFPGVKRLVLQGHHSHRPSADIKNAWSFTYIPYMP